LFLIHPRWINSVYVYFQRPTPLNTG